MSVIIKSGSSSNLAVVDSAGSLQVTPESGGFGGTQYATGTAEATPVGTGALGWDGTAVRILATDTGGQLKTLVENSSAIASAVATALFIGTQAAGSSMPVALPTATITSLTPPTAAAIGTAVSGDLLIGTQAAGSSVPVALPTATITTLTPPSAAAIAAAIVANPPAPPASSTASSPAQTSVGTSSSSILASNSARKEVIVVNTGTTILYLGLGQTPTTSAYHVALSPCATANDGTGGTYVSDLWKGAINAIGSGSGGTCVVTELT
jgi:hypothetical protein